MSCFFEIFSKVFGKETSAFQFNFTPPPPSPSCHAFLRFFLKFLDLIANTSICCWCCKAFPESSIPCFSRGCSAYNFLTSRICFNTMQKFVLFLLGLPNFISSKIFIYFFCFFSPLSIFFSNSKYISLLIIVFFPETMILYVVFLGRLFLTIYILCIHCVYYMTLVLVGRDGVWALCVIVVGLIISRGC